MAARALVFDILARDRASKEFAKVGDAADNAGKKGGKFGEAMKAGLAVGATAAVAFGAKAIKSASDMSETLSKSNVIFGAQAKEMEKWSRTAAQSFGLSQSAALDAATGFGNMFKQLGFTGKAAADNSKSIVQMAADLGSFNNVDPSEVLDKISGALRGEFDSLQALIPNINAARVEQEALAATGKKAAKELTAQEKATATLAIIQKDGAAAAGDFAKTSGGLANQQRILRARFDDVSAQVGTKLLPVVLDLLERFNELIEFTKRNKDTLVPLVAVIATATAGIYAINLATKVWTATTRAWTTVTKVATAVQKAFNLVLRMNPIGLVVTGLVLLGAGLVIAYKKSETFRDVVNGVFRAVVGFVVGAVDKVLGALEGIFRAASKIPGIGDKFKGVADKIAGARENVRGLGEKLDEVGRKKATPSIELMGAAKFRQELASAQRAMTAVGNRRLIKSLEVGDGPGRPTAGGKALSRVQGLLPGTGTYVTSTYRTPARNRAIGGSPTSYHLDRNNPAVDIGGPTGALDRLYGRLKAMGGWRELLWRVPGHYDHIHAAHTGAKVQSSWGKMPGWQSNERPVRALVGERVLSLPETQAYEAGIAGRSRGGSSGGGAVVVNINGPVYGNARDLAVQIRDELVRMKRQGVALGLA